MNNKGQSLVLFILIIPILTGIMALVIDAGKVFTTKSNQENTLELVLTYGLEDMKKDTLHEEDLEEFIHKNLEKNKNTINIEQEIITVSTKGEVEGIFSKLLGFNNFKVETELIGYLEEDKIKIEKIK